MIIRRKTIILIFFIYLFHTAGYGQTFLDAYKSYRLEKAERISNPHIKRQIKNFIHSEITALDTIFQSYNIRNKFNFNTADTLFLIEYSPADAPFTGDVIIWSGKDTLTYSQGFESIKSFKYKRIVTYGPFVRYAALPEGWKVLTERDSLITLVSKRNFNAIQHLGDNQNIADGSYVSVYVAYRDKKKYILESCFPNKFMIPDSYGKK